MKTADRENCGNTKKNNYKQKNLNMIISIRVR